MCCAAQALLTRIVSVHKGNSEPMPLYTCVTICYALKLGIRESCSRNPAVHLQERGASALSSGCSQLNKG
jgi:hypothetical protein